MNLQYRPFALKSEACVHYDSCGQSLTYLQPFFSLLSELKTGPIIQTGKNKVGYKRKDAPFRHQQISLLNFVHLASFCNTDPGAFLNEVIKCALEIQET
jgi:hypothetical protein